MIDNLKSVGIVALDLHASIPDVEIVEVSDADSCARGSEALIGEGT